MYGNVESSNFAITIAELLANAYANVGKILEIYLNKE